MKNSIIKSIFILIIMLTLVGWGKSEVRLLDSSKLIDLNKAIEFAKSGGNTGDSEDDNNNSSEISNDDKKEPDDNKDTNHDQIDNVTNNIVIRIREEKIFYTCGNKNLDGIILKQLENRIRLDYSSGTQITLVDDFAESQTYKNVCEILDGLKKDIGLNYNEDQLIGGM